MGYITEAEAKRAVEKFEKMKEVVPEYGQRFTDAEGTIYIRPSSYIESKCSEYKSDSDFCGIYLARTEYRAGLIKGFNKADKVKVDDATI